MYDVYVGNRVTFRVPFGVRQDKGMSMDMGIHVPVVVAAALVVAELVSFVVVARITVVALSGRDLCASFTAVDAQAIRQHLYFSILIIATRGGGAFTSHLKEYILISYSSGPLRL